ncbi:unnamed protein product [Symbiodinium natans]|uniref:WWE domain-containing protein n=1 Tax=Symbiodinium natans TaxID=878477 RepID=A0A812PUG6_9DINO|nr:unnamed protein product [Symbiodinium natans]
MVPLRLVLAVAFPSHAWGLIDVRLKPASRPLPQGQVVRWSWRAPGEVQFNITTKERHPLDFYMISGPPGELRIPRPWIHEVEPACKQCLDFHLHKLLGRNETMLIVSNKAGRSDLQLEFQEALFGVESCMEECFFKPTEFVAAALAAASLLCCSFLLSRRLARDEREGSRDTPWDEAWAPRLLQCKRPPKPAESWSAWILHACIITYPWNPWCNDPLTFGFRCLVLVVSWGLTLFVSTLYGDLFGEWDSSVSTLSSASSLTEGSKAGETPSMEGVMLISILSLAMETLLRILALSVFRCSLAAARVQQRRRMKASALSLAAAVVAACVIYPLTDVLSKHRCGYVQHLFMQFLMSEAVRGLPLAAAVASAQYGLLKAWFLPVRGLAVSYAVLRLRPEQCLRQVFGRRAHQHELALSQLSLETSCQLWLDMRQSHAVPEIQDALMQLFKEVKGRLEQTELPQGPAVQGIVTARELAEEASELQLPIFFIGDVESATQPTNTDGVAVLGHVVCAKTSKVVGELWEGTVAPPAHAGRWLFDLDSDWQSWPEQGRGELEKLHGDWLASGSPDESFELVSGPHSYLINFVRMTQTNTRTGKMRKLRREEQHQHVLHLQEALEGGSAAAASSASMSP